MKKSFCINFTFSIAALFCLVISSCSYGPYPFTFFQQTVDQRSSEITDFSGTQHSPSVGTDSEYSFIVITDVHFGSDKSTFQNSFINKFSKLYDTTDTKLKPRFVVCLGDCSNNGKPDEWQKYNAFLEQLKDAAASKGFSDLKCYSCIGNHDCYNLGGSEFSSYVYPYKTAYKFNVKADSSTQGFSYYFLDTANATLGKNQMKSFKQHLANDSAPKIVMTHYQIYSGCGILFLIQDYTERNMLLSLFAKNNIKMVLEGHQHDGASYENNYFKEYTLKSTMKKVFYRVTVNESTQQVNIEQIDF
ncbi:metallophosphoesterase [Treponema sp.]|uniref:metallophosphoesterase family protein n=1 Tax=Treponema sp. TaxID=166 RepID=UPI00298DB717|nr:metallophosphoesterase [Treponema sp.]MCR5613656.1 metallophosphoesterase [Treponema sp.]